MVSPKISRSVTIELKRIHGTKLRTRGKGLLQLISLLSIVEDESVEMTVASDFEFDQSRTLGSLLYISE